MTYEVFSEDVRKVVPVDELPGKQYFLRLRSHVAGLVAGPLISKEDLPAEIEDRVRNQCWDENYLAVDNGSLRFLKEFLIKGSG